MVSFIICVPTLVRDISLEGSDTVIKFLQLLLLVVKNASSYSLRKSLNVVVWSCISVKNQTFQHRAVIA